MEFIFRVVLFYMRELKQRIRIMCDILTLLEYQSTTKSTSILLFLSLSVAPRKSDTSIQCNIELTWRSQ